MSSITTVQGGSRPVHTVTVKRFRIPMRDGVRLFATAWHPEGDGPFPVVVNYDPYRAADVRTLGRGNWFHYLARHGYVVVHLGVRGTDASEGIVWDEYLPQEQEDGCEAVEWLAAQPWCNGNVGMMGTSYSGYTPLQVALHRPPHLKAIVPLFGGDDRYTDDVHYTSGGALRALCDMPSYSTRMVCMNALPPHESAGAEAAAIWEAHLKGDEPYLIPWLEHQTDGPYWRQGSIRPNYDRIDCPTFIVSGWFDGYPNATLRLLQHLQVPRKALIGPWTHVFPEWGMPEPKIGFMAQAIRWFDHWLKGIDTGILDEPPLIVYVQEYDAPHPGRRKTSGYWRAEPGWPLAGAQERPLYLGPDGGLRPEAGSAGSDVFTYRATVGIHGRSWGGMPWLQNAGDQRADELASLVYTAEPLQESLEILGQARVRVTFASTAPVVNVTCKLSDVAPDGASALITSGTLNVTHRSSHIDPQPLVPGEQYAIEIALDATGWRFVPGHRIRLAISGGDWPNVWPSPYPATNTVWWGGSEPSRLILPVVPIGRREDAPDMGEPALPLERYVLHTKPVEVRVTRDPHVDAVAYAGKEGEWGSIPGEVGYAYEREYAYVASDRDPAHSAVSTIHSMQVTHHGSTTRALVHGRLSSTVDSFQLFYNLLVTVDGAEYFRRSWGRSFPRHLV